MTFITTQNINDIQAILGSEFEVSDNPYGLSVVDRRFSSLVSARLEGLGLQDDEEAKANVTWEVSDERHEVVSKAIEAVLGQELFDFSSY